MNMEGDTEEIPWDAIPRKKRSMLQRKKRVNYDQGSVAEETTEATAPEWILKLMKTYEGYDANQIMEVKELTRTDLNTNQGRLLLPKHVDRSFLNDGELEILAAVHKKKGVRSLFIDTKEEEYDLELREWKNGLVLTKGWCNVINNKDVFKVGEKYPLWCFRSRNKNDKLCFALVKPDQVEDPIEVLPNVDNKDAKLSETEEEVANKSETESSSLFGHVHPPEPPESLGGVSSLLGQDMDGSQLENFNYRTQPDCNSFEDELLAYF